MAADTQCESRLLRSRRLRLRRSQRNDDDDAVRRGRQRCEDGDVRRRWRCADGDAGSAVQPVTAALGADAVRTATLAALCSQRERRCEGSGAGAVKTAAMAALCSQRQRRCAADSGDGAVKTAVPAL
eukprot:2074983-Pleurochrysis_carterae.AAC.2